MKVIPKRYRIRIYSEAVKLLQGEKEECVYTDDGEIYKDYKAHGFCYLFAFTAAYLQLPKSSIQEYITGSIYCSIWRYPEMKAYEPIDASAYWFPPMKKEGIARRLNILKDILKNLNDKT